jgi:hypothetical protein
VSCRVGGWGVLSVLPSTPTLGHKIGLYFALLSTYTDTVHSLPVPRASAFYFFSFFLRNHTIVSVARLPFESSSWHTSLRTLSQFTEDRTVTAVSAR